MRAGYVAAGIALVGILLLAHPVTGQSVLAASPEAWVGEEYRVGWSLPWDAKNVTLLIEGGTDAIAFQAFGDDRFGSWSGTVTREWGESGIVRLRWDNSTNPNEEQQSFRVMCGASCQAAALSATSWNYIIAAIVTVFIALFFAGHAAVVYAHRSGGTPWTDHVSMAVRSRIRRDPMYRARTDAIGMLPAGIRSELDGLRESVEEMRRIQIPAKRVWSKMAGFSRSVARLGKRAEELGLLKQTSSANAGPATKPPEETPRKSIPSGNPEPAVIRMRRKPAKTGTADELADEWERGGGVKVERPAYRKED